MEWQSIEPALKELVKAGFKDSNTKMSKDALKALQVYLALFVEEGIARAESKCQSEEVELENVEQVFLQLILDFS